MSQQETTLRKIPLVSEITGMSLGISSLCAFVVAAGLTLFPQVAKAQTRDVVLRGTVTGFSEQAPSSDDLPDGFAFAPTTEATPYQPAISAPITLTGIDVPIAMGVTGAGNPLLRINGGPSVSSGTAVSGDTIEVSLVPTDWGQTYLATVAAGSGSAVFSVTTALQDVTPQAFAFAAVTDANPGAVTTSAAQTISGITGDVPISISGEGAPEYSLDGGVSWTKNAGIITSGTVVAMRLTAGAALATRTAALTVGTETANFAVTAVEPIPPCFNPANVGTIGQAEWGECAGKLIVSTAQLRAASSVYADGNATFAITGPDGQSYTFANGVRTIFTGQVTDMSLLFFYTSYNGDISHWNTSNATSLYNIFGGNNSFNQPIGNWDTANVVNMSNAFATATAFNQSLYNWDTGKVVDMSLFFYGAQGFNQDISNWNTSSVTTMYAMFSGASLFNQNISNWDTANVTDMKMMFYTAPKFNQNLSSWCVTKITALPVGFKSGTAWTLPKPVWGTCPAP